MMTALVFTATYVIKIPSPTGGYKNLGDCFVFLSAWLLGPFWGTAAAAIGSALSDFFSYPHYTLVTLIVKGFEALVFWLISRLIRNKTVGFIVGGLIGGAVMVSGYFLNAYFIWGKTESALVSVFGNLIQAALGIMIGLILMQFVTRTRLDRYFKE